MGSFDIPGIKLDTKALYEFAQELGVDLPKDLTGARDGINKLPMKVGGSGLPAAVTMGNWNGMMLFSLGTHMGKIGTGIGALSEAATAIGTIYQNSDCDAQAQMDAVTSTLTPKPGDKTFQDRLAQDAQDAETRAIQQRQDIQEEATRTAIASNRADTPSASSTNADGAQVCVDGDTQSEAQRLVKDHIDAYGGDEGSVTATPTPTPGPSPTPYPTSTAGPYGTASATPTYRYSSPASPSPQVAPSPTLPQPTSAARPQPTSTSEPSQPAAPTSPSSLPTATSEPTEPSAATPTSEPTMSVTTAPTPG